ncbi:MAG: GTP cyclohydrolase [Flavobacteriaceae bacterium]|nr:GTP cyclohydrolase [Flavobacteriaceae bacterium]MCY4216417.1 GTP cyclohydrolase [Flavobacteriaceae bacterium]MCY4253728.1 GTP cyclohydrolase [Flavobacteriaceae bacterium]
MESKPAVKSVRSNKDYYDFVKFPFQIYKNHPYWVPPLIIDEFNTLKPNKNPVYKNADAQLFLAFQNKEIVGRIAVMVNWLEVNKMGKQKARFGWYDAIDDLEISELLFREVEKFALKHNLELIEGPLGFSNFEKAGLLTYGYDQMPTLGTIYNHPYYHQHLVQLGFKQNLKWVEYEIDFPAEENLHKLNRFSDFIKTRYQLKVVQIKKTKHVFPYLYELFDLIEESHKSLETYVPIQKSQIENYKNRFLKFISPQFIKLIVDKDDKLIAFSVIIPSIEKALQKANGRLFPFGIFHIKRSLAKNNKAAFYLIGVHPSYMGKGIPSIIFNEMAKVFASKKIQTFETNPELETNLEIQQLWKKFNPKLHKRRATFYKTIS